MSRKASGDSDSLLIPYEGISKPVFEYKFKELFGSKATYTEVPSRNVSQSTHWKILKLTHRRVG
jgi:hypothetical protein